MSSDLNGVLVIDKPPGMTSHAVVAEVSRRLGRVKAGHAGTLDPMATGVLVVCLGEATKLSGVLTAADKAYEAELELGVETDTLDADGRVTRERRAEAAEVDRARLAAAAAALLGPRTQVPPMYSAVKTGGRRLHELARAGAEVERAPRPIQVHRLELVSFDPPRASLRVECSKGTYVRSLAAELGEALGCGAHLTALRRTRSGPFGLDRAVALDEVGPGIGQAGRLIPLAEAVATLPRVLVPPALAAAVENGKKLKWLDISADPAPAGPVALLDPGGHLMALIEVEGDRLVYRRVFRQGS